MNTCGHCGYSFSKVRDLVPHELECVHKSAGQRKSWIKRRTYLNMFQTKKRRAAFFEELAKEEKDEEEQRPFPPPLDVFLIPLPDAHAPAYVGHYEPGLRTCCICGLSFEGNGMLNHLAPFFHAITFTHSQNETKFVAGNFHFQLAYLKHAYENDMDVYGQLLRPFALAGMLREGVNAAFEEWKDKQYASVSEVEAELNNNNN